jgi:hypothetical protein
MERGASVCITVNVAANAENGEMSIPATAQLSAILRPLISPSRKIFMAFTLLPILMKRLAGAHLDQFCNLLWLIGSFCELNVKAK